PQHDLAWPVDPVNLEHRLRQIDADYTSVLHRVLLSTQTGKTAGRVERRPRHQLRTQARQLSACLGQTKAAERRRECEAGGRPRAKPRAACACRLRLYPGRAPTDGAEA